MTHHSPVPTSDFAQTPNLTDPLVLIQQCEAVAQGIDRQGQASQPGSLMGGHPSPSFFYSQASDVLRACVAFIKLHAPPPPVVETPKPETPTKPVVGKPVVVG
jgi:hypothetical protein